MEVGHEITRPRRVGEIETFLREQLTSRGWAITGESRDGLDVDIEVKLAGTAGRFRLRHAMSAPEALMHSPAFVRVDLGEPGGLPERWGAAHVVESVGEDQSVSLGYQVAIGRDWASVAVGTDLPQHAPWQAVIHRVLDRAEALAPGQALVPMFQGIEGCAESSQEGSTASFAFLQIVFTVVSVAVVPIAWRAEGWQVGLGALMVVLLVKSFV